MSHPETYFYGQGKVYLAPLLPNGRPGVYRWVGDVSALNVALTVEKLAHKESYSGQRITVRSFPTSKDGTVTATWNDRSPENLAIVFYGHQAVVPAGTVTGEVLPTGIKAGDRVALLHQNVSTVVIGTLVEGKDYTVDVMYGAIDFLTAPPGPATTAKYAYKGGLNTTLFTEHQANYALRYEAINLAENGSSEILELYKVAFEPLAALSLINTDTTIGGMETSAAILFNNAMPADTLLGRFGRYIHVAEPV